MLSKTAELDDLLNELLLESDGMDDPSLLATRSQLASARRLSSEDHRVPWWRQRPAPTAVEEMDAGYVTREEADRGDVADGNEGDRNNDSPRPPPRGTSVAVMDG